jgi:hypothetical protein
MATQIIAFPVAARQNTNDDSTAYSLAAIFLDLCQ